MATLSARHDDLSTDEIAVKTGTMGSTMYTGLDTCYKHDLKKPDNYYTHMIQLFTPHPDQAASWHCLRFHQPVSASLRSP